LAFSIKTKAELKKKTDEYLHQQARLTAGTVAYNDKLSTDFRHFDGRVIIKSE
jgi:hypothetical protein